MTVVLAMTGCLPCFGGPALVRLPADRGNLCLGRDPEGHSVKPGTERVSDPERARLADEHQESGLEGVVDIMRVAQHSLADAEHHRPVAFSQSCESGLRRFPLSCREYFQQMLVRQAARGSQPEECTHLPKGHRWL